ncbi:MAG: NAD-dependent epimerase/dehydratase [Parcubacteria group bacterium GW2011_GWA2_51_10]|nr:MAG: NAD-dependent epimerase/dehydratase [Parcubacteria group bacterium GW2011_GWA2_51_10]
MKRLVKPKKKFARPASARKIAEEPKSILITGGAGFVGSNVLRYLWKRYPRSQFHVLDALTYAGDLRNIPDEIHSDPRFHFWYGDVRNAKLVEAIVAQCDIVIHFAAETHVARSIHDDINFFSTDVIGTQVVTSAVLQHKGSVKRFIHTSTSEVYGTARTETMDEMHPLEPQSPYAAAKTGADRLVYSYITTHAIPAVIIRPFNLYGPNQHLEKLIPRFITSALLGESMTIHGSGESRRDFTYVEDLARAIELIIEAPGEKVNGEVFNIANSRATSVLEIADMILKIRPVKTKKKAVFTEYTLNIGDRPGQVFKHIGNTDKIRSVLGWKPRVSFEEGIKKTIAWYEGFIIEAKSSRVRLRRRVQSAG